MYSRHAHTALRRGQSIPNDVSRVTEGIAASLRQFSLSAQRCADEQPSSPPSRSQRFAQAAREISSLPASFPPQLSKGIDARSLAAKPPGQRFTIRRMDDRSDAQLAKSPISRAPSLRGGSSISRGGGLSGGRGGGRGGATRGRGLRGRNAAGPRQKRQKHAEEIDYEIAPYDEVEAAAYDEITGGIPTAYEPVTSPADLKGWGPGVITSSQGIRESVDRTLAIGMDKKYPGFNSVRWHKQKVGKIGYTVLRDETERGVFGDINKKVKGSSVAAEQRAKLEKSWVAGHYEKPGAAQSAKDAMGMVGAYSRKNPAFLAEESKQLEADILKLLPESLQKQVRNAQKSAA